MQIFLHRNNRYCLYKQPDLVQILAGKENLGIGALIEYTLSTFSKIKFQNGVFIAMP